MLTLAFTCLHKTHADELEVLCTECVSNSAGMRAYERIFSLAPRLKITLASFNMLRSSVTHFNSSLNRQFYSLLNFFLGRLVLINRSDFASYEGFWSSSPNVWQHLNRTSFFGHLLISCYLKLFVLSFAGHLGLLFKYIIYVNSRDST